MYHVSKTSLKKRFADGFNILVPYTFGKNLGNAHGNVRSYIKNAHNLSAEYGPAAPYIQQRLSVSNLYELSVGKERGGVKRHKWDSGGNPDCGNYRRPTLGCLQ